MENYYNKITSSKRKAPCPSSSPSTTNIDNLLPTTQRKTRLNVIDLDDLPSDPSERQPILSYNVNQRDEIRRHYLGKMK